MGVQVQMATSSPVAKVGLSLSSSLPASSARATPPQWRPDAWSDCCHCCHRAFSWLWSPRRRHHCRACGELVCGECSPFVQPLPSLGYPQAVRVCRDCQGPAWDLSCGFPSGSASASASSTAAGSSSSSTACSSSSSSSTSSCSSSSWRWTRPAKGNNATAIATDQNADQHEDDGDVDDNDDDDDEQQLIFDAVEVLAIHSSDKHDKLLYDYFVQSEAINWLVDAQIVHSRRTGAALFTLLEHEGYITKKHGVSSSFASSLRTKFYRLNDLISTSRSSLGSEERISRYDPTIHAETQKCCNCARAFLESMTPTPGFCSIDCKTNASLRREDWASARGLL